MGECDLVRSLMLDACNPAPWRLQPRAVEAACTDGPMHQCNLCTNALPVQVRNLLLGHIADDEQRVLAYDTLWRPIERRHGDGDSTPLEFFLSRFVERREGGGGGGGEGGGGGGDGGGGEGSGEGGGEGEGGGGEPGGGGAEARQGAPAPLGTPLSLDQASVASSVAAEGDAAARRAAGGKASVHQRFAALLANAGGNRGVSLYDDGSGAALVSAGGAEAAQRAATEMLRQMLDASVS